jgi:uncharacterized protein YyaL (SSP411 family)
VLRTLADVWKTRREDALENAGKVLAAIEHGEAYSGRTGMLAMSIVEKLVESGLQQFDARNGGFGTQPKFPHASTMDLMIDLAARTGDERVKQAVVVTLKKMAAGGVYDQLGGGFHRYSVDEQWIVPHFEKMLYDNAGLLGNYVHAFQTFVDGEFAGVALDVIRWMDACLSDRERGGFYASQDADINLDDDGDYFTWTLDEAQAVLTAEEMALAGPYFDIGEVGDMHHNPKKNVLHRKRGLEAVAAEIGLPQEEAEQRLKVVKGKLLEARRGRPTPFIDKTIYTGWNGLAVSAYLRAARVLDLEPVTAFALKTLDRVLAEAWSADAGLKHVVAYAEGSGKAVAGVLDDYAFVSEACVEAWESTGERRYYEAAQAIADAMVARFYDRTGGGFFDTEQDGSKLGALAARRKPLQDSPTPAGNPAAAAVLVRLEELSGEAKYKEMAEETLESFAGVVEHFGIYAGTYGLALLRLLLEPVQVVIVGSDEPAKGLAAMARARYAVNKMVVRLGPERLQKDLLPPALAETLPEIEWAGKSFALVCEGRTCQPPTSDAEELLKAVSY